MTFFFSRKTVSSHVVEIENKGRRETPFRVNFLLPFHALDNNGMCVAFSAIKKLSPFKKIRSFYLSMKKNFKN